MKKEIQEIYEKLTKLTDEEKDYFAKENLKRATFYLLLAKYRHN